MRPLAAALSLLILLVSACASSGSSPAPSGAGPVTSPAEAAALVVASDRRFAGAGERNPDIIGGCCFWDARQAGEGFEVTIEIGWGDCFAGCIERHTWTYSVSRDGAILLTAEQGDPVPVNIGGGGGGILPGGSGIAGRAVAGPTCPVQQVGDPSCEARPIAGAAVVVLDANGTEIARVVSAPDGTYSVVLPPGNYVIEPQPVEGLMGTAEPIPVTITDGVVTVDLAYDTGIR